MANIVAIVGRPNVGKSTLFNRLIESRKAIMDNESGVTRDRHYGYADWSGKFFTVIDTGGYVVGSDDIFEGAIREQVEIAIEEASVVLFIVDVATGLTDLDKDFAAVLRRIKHFPEEGIENPEEGIPRFAVLGRPNVGKSSFVNVLLGKERSIVTDIAGTTRDSIHTHYNAFGKEFILIDTAGLRRKSKVKDNIEFYSVMRSIQALEEADVCIVIVDATRGIEAQDVNIIALAAKNRKGVVIMVNKWDLVEKDQNTAKKFTDTIMQKLAPMAYFPVVFTSVTEKQRIFKAVEKAIEVYENRTKKIPTSALNDTMLKEIDYYPPPAIKGKFVKIKYITQLPAKTPTFAFFCNLPQYIQPAYERYLENKLREHFDFEGVPVSLVFRKK
jgi:GTP-binding protein